MANHHARCFAYLSAGFFHVVGNSEGTLQEELRLAIFQIQARQADDFLFHKTTPFTQRQMETAFGKALPSYILT